MGAIHGERRFQTERFLAKIGRQPVEGLQLAVAPAASVDMVYPLEDSTFRVR